MPLELLRGVEDRAVTPAPSDVGASQQPIIPYVFLRASAAFLGVDMPTVPTGEAVSRRSRKKRMFIAPPKVVPLPRTPQLLGCRPESVAPPG